MTESKSINVAITGASGYCGQKLIERLQSEGSVGDIVAIDVKPLPLPTLGKVIFYKRDINESLASIFEDHKIDTLVHLAFVMNPAHSPENARRANVDGTASVLESCRQSGVNHIVYFSSSSVYGAHADNPCRMSEDWPTRPLEGFQYSENKLEAESLIMNHAESHSDFSAIVLRGCPVIGDHAQNFILDAFTRPLLVGIRGYDPQFQLLHEDDMCEAIWNSICKRASGIYNLASDGTVSWNEMASIYGRSLIRLPASVLYLLVAVAWKLRLQGDSPPSGLNFIRYSWKVDTTRSTENLGVNYRHTAKDCWQSFVSSRKRQTQSIEENIT